MNCFWHNSRRNFGLVADIVLALFLLSFPGVHAATITVKTNKIGVTPEIIGYNAGHHYPGSNTKDWWHYSGVSGARIFITPSTIELSDDISGHGDGVTDQASFLNRKAALRANPLSTTYINWPYITNKYEVAGGSFRVNAAFSEMRQLGLRLLVNISATLGSFDIINDNDWAGKWELWQHYYFQSFYLGREFDVERYQMFNEPDHSSAGGITTAQYLQRLQLASDAIQSALTDVNQLYGKRLTPMILAPVITTSGYNSWSAMAVTNRHKNFLGQVNTNFFLLNRYDYHQYGNTNDTTTFGNNLASLRSSIASTMSPETPFPVTITEFNVHTAGNLNMLTETLDSPTKYPRLGEIAVDLMKNLIDQMYCFKFSQTFDTSTGRVKKNGMHYVDNDNAPYNIGTITKAGEVWRLFNKAFRSGRDRLDFTLGTGATQLDVQTSFDPVSKRYYIFSANNTASAVSLNFDLSSWKIPTNNPVLVEEVSENYFGGGKIWTNLTSQIVSGTQPANSVWLLTIPGRPQEIPQTITVSDDTTVKDGVNKFLSFGLLTNCFVGNNSTNPSSRSAAFLKFSVPAINPTNLELAVLSVHTMATNGGPVWAHVYGITNNNWSQTTLYWNSAPNLAQNIAAGTNYTNNFVTGAGTSAEIVGQLTGGNSLSERFIDVTDFVRNHPGSSISFLLVRPVGFSGDAEDNDILSIISKEGDMANAPRLALVINSTNVSNTAPTAVNDTAVTEQSTPVVVDVLANDSDADNDPLSIQSFTQGTTGMVATNNSKQLVYTPNAGFYGTDNFNYTISDGKGLTASATVNVTVRAEGTKKISTNATVVAEANIRGGTSAGSDVDEVTANYVIVKYYTPPYDLARKAYFQFNFTGLDLDMDAAATLTFNFNSTGKQRVQLWGLNQDYPAFNSFITWNTAQANDINSNDLLTTGALSATAIGGSVVLPVSGTAPFSFTIPRMGDFVFNNRATFVLSGVDDSVNNSAGGLRIQRTNTLLTVSAHVPSPVVTNIITGITKNSNGTVTLAFLGTPQTAYRVLSSTNAGSSNWLSIFTNVTTTNGTWLFNDLESTNYPARFYQSVSP